MPEICTMGGMSVEIMQSRTIPSSPQSSNVHYPGQGIKTHHKAEGKDIQHVPRSDGRFRMKFLSINYFRASPIQVVLLQSEHLHILRDIE